MAELQEHQDAPPAGEGSDRGPENGGVSFAKTEMTLHQLRIFWAVAHAETLTKAAKQLGLTQPSLSQQLSKLETSVGARLFDRTPGQMALTDAGSFLLRKAEHILSNVTEAAEGLRQFSDGRRATLRVAGLHSALRVLLPAALPKIMSQFPDLEIDLHEAAPAETLELLYGRRVNVGLVAEASVASAGVGFRKVPVFTDSYVFAVPKGITLEGVTDPDHELDASDTAVVNSCIEFSFGTQHTRRVEQWYAEVLPRHRIVAQCRSFETALAMVQAGVGVCLVPALTALDSGRMVEGVNLYRSTEPDRTIVALIPGQYQRVEPYRSFLDALAAAGRELSLPQIAETPPFLRRAQNLG